MFDNLTNPVSAYKSVSVDAAVAMSDPHRLILMLFDGALIAVGEARSHMAQGSIAEKGVSVSKAIDIIDNGLKASLDVRQGGELAQRLSALYDYMLTRLIYANLRNNVAALDEVTGLLGDLRGAWAEIGKAQRPDAGSAAA